MCSLARMKLRTAVYTQVNGNNSPLLFGVHEPALSDVASTSGLPSERKTWENWKEASRRPLKCSVGWSTGHGKGAVLLQPGKDKDKERKTVFYFQIMY